MKNIFNTDLKNIIEQRVSVRNYSDRVVDDGLLDNIMKYTQTIQNPFGIKVNFSMINLENNKEIKKIGTYGTIKGAKIYMALSAAEHKFSLEAIAYELEYLILYLTSLGLGTCILGVSFNKNTFLSAMKIEKSHIFPVVTPIGYPLNKKKFSDTITKFISKSNMRKEWKDIFFYNNLDTPLTKNAAKEYSLPLEMLRLSPSALNKQPWRIIKNKDFYHFYIKSDKKYKLISGFDIQRLDMGIAALHFHLSAIESGLNGIFNFDLSSDISVPNELEYCFSWHIQ